MSKSLVYFPQPISIFFFFFWKYPNNFFLMDHLQARALLLWNSSQALFILISPILLSTVFDATVQSPSIDLSSFLSCLMKRRQEREICPSETSQNQRDVFTPDEPAGFLSPSPSQRKWGGFWSAAALNTQAVNAKDGLRWKFAFRLCTPLQLILCQTGERSG